MDPILILREATSICPGMNDSISTCRHSLQVVSSELPVRKPLISRLSASYNPVYLTQRIITIIRDKTSPFVFFCLVKHTLVFVKALHQFGSKLQNICCIGPSRTLELLRNSAEFSTIV